MKKKEAVYYSLIGELIDPVPGVRNAFGEGEQCSQLYTEVQEAYQRIRERLHIEDENPDVEMIIDSLLMIQKLLCVWKCLSLVGNIVK